MKLINFGGGGQVIALKSATALILYRNMNKLIFVILFCAYLMPAQNNLNSGTIYITNGQVYNFKDLQIKDSQVIFVNTETNKKVYYLLNTVISIYDHEDNAFFVNNTLSLAPKPELSIAKNENAEATEESVELYPEGAYLTKEDFIQKKVSELLVKPKLIYNMQPFSEDNLPDQIYFFNKKTNAKIKNVFAISYQNKLYFQVKSILKNQNKKDKSQTNQNPNSYIRVLEFGNRYLYLEVKLASKWEQGFYYGGIGGAAGGTLAEMAIKNKGVVWDFNNAEFNIFRNCKDFNAFLNGQSTDLLDCTVIKNKDFNAQLILEKLKDLM